MFRYVDLFYHLVTFEAAFEFLPATDVFADGLVLSAATARMGRLYKNTSDQYFFTVLLDDKTFFYFVCFHSVNICLYCVVC